MSIVKCNICKKEFYVKPSYQKLGYGKYCSRACQYLGQRKGRYVKCDICGTDTWKMPKQLRKSRSGKYFCSKSCQTIWRNTYFSGPLHSNWKDGTNKDYRKVITRSSKKQACRLCDNEDKRILVVHHLNKKRDDNRIENLEWLCANCHQLVHRHNEEI